MNMTTVLKRLDRFINDGVLDLRYEVKCGDRHDIDTVSNYSNHYDKEIFCNDCNDLIPIGFSNIYPVYHINREYKNYIKKSEGGEI